MISRGRLTMARAALAAGALLALALPAAAMGAQRYASPTGTGTACTSASPCDLQQALGFAASADDVIVKAGTYNLNNDSLLVTGTMNVHGAAGEGIPQLNFNAPSSQAVNVTGTARLARLRIDVAGNSRGVSLGSGTLGEQLHVRARGSAQVACGLILATLRDSVCFGSGTDSEGLIASGDGTVTLRNVTIDGEDVGLDAFAGNADENLVVDVQNSVFQADGLNSDIAAFATNVTSTANVVANHSNYDSIMTQGPGVATITPVGSGTNQDGTDPPEFADPANGDFHQLATSPTRNAGATDSLLGTLDFEGDPRSQGSAPDIGADEYDDTAPNTTITSAPPASTTQKSATFTFTADEPATYECSMDGSPYEQCFNPLSVANLLAGFHTVHVRATDANGNVETTPATHSWTVKAPAKAKKKCKKAKKKKGKKRSADSAAAKKKKKKCKKKKKRKK
jgi:hypothetical protein